MPAREDSLSWLQKISESEADRPYLIEAGTGAELTYAEVHTRAIQVAATLAAQGFQRGDRVVVSGDTSIELACFYFGCLYRGVTVVPVNPTSTTDDFHYILQAVRAKGLALASDSPHDFATLAASQPALQRLSLIGEAKNAATKVRPFEGMTEDDEALIVFTSGTTARPKGVVHRIGSLVANARLIGKAVGLRERSRFYHLLPMTYLGGYYNLLLLPFVWKSSVVLGRAFGPTSIFDFWKPIVRFDVDTLWLVPSILSLLLKMDRGTEGERHCREKVKVTFCGTAPLPLALKEAFEKRYGVTLLQNFALSETLFLTSNLPGKPTSANSVGHLLDGIELKIVNTEGEEAKAEEEGELLARSPYRMLGYLDPQTGKPARLKSDEWFATGDMGKRASNGEHFITGRSKDLIIRGGINLSPAAIEEAIYDHPAVIDCAVVGAEDAVMGEEVVAVLKLEASADFGAVEASLRELCSKRLAKFKCPSRYVELADFPRTASGKIQKNKIRAWLSQRLRGTEATVSVAAPRGATTDADFLRPSKVVEDIVEAMSIKFNTLVYEARQRKEDVIVLSLGEAFFDIPLFPFDDLPFPELYHYSHSRGIPELRAELADYFLKQYDVAFDPEKEILLTAGSKIAIYMALLALLNPNDEVIVLEPGWVSYTEQIKLCHAIPVAVPYHEGIADLHRYVTNRTRVVIINSPNNPSGKIYTLEELSMLYALAKKHGLYILSDEAYSDFTLDAQRFISMGNLDLAKSHTVIINSISKNFGISGWRLGYLISNDRLIQQMLKLNQHLVTCPPTVLSQYIAKHFKEIIAITKPQIRALVERRAELAAYMDQLGMTYLAGDATFYFFVSIGDSTLGSEAFCEELLKKHHVCAVPGIGYGVSCDRFIRVSVGAESQERIKQGLTRIRTLIRATTTTEKTQRRVG